MSKTPKRGSDDAMTGKYGQIYVPFVNWIMMFFTVALAVGFGNSDRLAGAYGTAVSTTMALTTVLLYEVMRHRWRWTLYQAAAAAGLLLAVDLAFLSANFSVSGKCSVFSRSTADYSQLCCRAPTPAAPPRKLPPRPL
jgi:K+ transporter